MVLKRVSFFVATNILFGLINFLLLPILTSKLTTYDYGIIQFFFSLSRVVSIFISSGITFNLINKFYSDLTFFKNSYWSFITFTSLFSFFLVVLIYFISILFHLNFNPFFYILIVLFSILNIFFELNITILTYEYKKKHYLFIFSIKTLIELSILLIYIHLLNLNWIGRIISIFISTLVVTMLTTIYFYRKYSNKSYSFITYKNVFIDSIPLIFFNISIVVFDVSDRIFINYFFGESTSGLYGVSYTISSLLLIAFSALLNVIKPKIFNYLKKDSKSKHHIKLFAFFISIMLLAYFFMLYSKVLFYNYLVDSKFFSYIWYVDFISLSFVIWMIYNFLITYLQYYNKNKSIMVISIVGSVTNIVLNIILLKIFGPIGAVYSTIISCALMITLTLKQITKIRNVKENLS